MTIDEMQKQLDQYQRQDGDLPDVIILSNEDFNWYRAHVNYETSKPDEPTPDGLSMKTPLFNGVTVQPEFRRNKYVDKKILEIK